MNRKEKAAAGLLAGVKAGHKQARLATRSPLDTARRSSLAGFEGQRTGVDTPPVDSKPS